MERSVVLRVVCAGILWMAGFPAMGAIISWTDWTSSVRGYPGTAAGTATLLDARAIAVSYSGELRWSQTNGSGTDYWHPDDPYLSSTVENAPPDSDILQVDGPSSVQSPLTNTLAFSETVTNPLLAIVSMGSGSIAVQYDFEAPFIVLSEGKGYWGDGTYQLLEGDVLEGREFHGVIQFPGEFDEISWVI